MFSEGGSAWEICSDLFIVAGDILRDTFSSQLLLEDKNKTEMSQSILCAHSTFFFLSSP